MVIREGAGLWPFKSGWQGGSTDPGNLGGRGGQKTLPSVGGGGGGFEDFFWNNPLNEALVNTPQDTLQKHGTISLVKSS